MKCRQTFVRGLILLFVGYVGIAFMFVPKTARAEPTSEGALWKLAMHQGYPHGGRHERHPMHHGMGRGGKGICPQTRITAQAPVTVYNLKNPLQPTRKNLTRGESIYQWTAEPSACKVCHGPSGNGMGMMAQSMQAMPRNFTCEGTMKEVTDGQMYWIIKNGSHTGMPPYLFLSEDDVWSVILYLRQFAQ